MHSIYKETDASSMLVRLKSLQPEATRQWGTMDVGQMLAHVNASLETALGRTSPKRIFLGRIIGKLVKRRFLNENPMQKNAPTDKNFVFTAPQNFTSEKLKAIELFIAFTTAGPSKCTTHPHSFFGKMTAEEWGVLQWKHFDHHLRQFGA